MPFFTNFKGIHKTSLVDFPGKICSILFAGGCNLNCRYCYNPELVNNSKGLDTKKTADVLDFLKKRSGLIEGVVISGGEPTLQKNLGKFLEEIKAIPLAVKIDTNGLKPAVIEELLKKRLIDYIAVDIKTSPGKYGDLTRTQVDFNDIKKTIETAKNSGTDYEVRTTCVPGYVELEDFKKIYNEIGNIKKYYLQQFNNKITLDSSLQHKYPYTIPVLEKFRDYIKTFAEVCEIRGV